MSVILSILDWVFLSATIASYSAWVFGFPVIGLMPLIVPVKFSKVSENLSLSPVNPVNPLANNPATGPPTKPAINDNGLNLSKA